MQQNTETNLSKSKITSVSKLNNEFLTFCPTSREEWRKWLEKNHQQQTKTHWYDNKAYVIL